MNWFYIMVRTFPFWGIPMGAGLVTTGLRTKGKKKWAIFGVLLCVGSVAFLFFQGHFKAVPFIHEALYGGRR